MINGITGTGSYEITELCFSPSQGVMAEREDKTGHSLELRDMWAPIVMQMGRAANYKDEVLDFGSPANPGSTNSKDAK